MSFDETHMPGFNIGAAEIQANDDWEEIQRHVSIVKVRGVETNERQIGGGFSGRVTALFASLLLAAQKFHLRWITITTGSGRFYSPSDRRILLRRSARDYRSIRISILRLNATEAKNGIRRGGKTLRLEYQVVFGYTICSLKYTDRPFFFLPFPLLRMYPVLSFLIYLASLVGGCSFQLSRNFFLHVSERHNCHPTGRMICIMQ